MPLGALTLSQVDIKGPLDSVFAYDVSLVGPASYTTGGDTGLQAAIRAATGKAGLEVMGVIDIGLNGGYVTRYDKANDKLIHLTSNGAAAAALAQFTSSGSLAGTTFLLCVLCR